MNRKTKEDGGKAERQAQTRTALKKLAPHHEKSSLVGQNSTNIFRKLDGYLVVDGLVPDNEGKRRWVKHTTVIRTDGVHGNIFTKYSS